MTRSLAAQAPQERAAAPRRYPRAPVSAAAPLLCSIRGCAARSALWSTAPAFGGGPNRPHFAGRRTITPTGDGLALRDGPCSRLGRGSTKLSRLQRSSWADGATRDDKGRLPTRRNRLRDTEPPHARTGEIWRDARGRVHDQPVQLSLSPTFEAVPRKRSRPAPPCRRALGARALLHQRCQTSVTSSRSVEGEQAHCQPARAVQAKTGGVAAVHGWRARWRGPIRLPHK